MDRVIIRDFEESDSVELYKLESRCFSTPMTLDYIRNIPLKNNVSFSVCVDEKGSFLGYAGFMWVLDEGSILSIAVNESARMNGIGALLIDSLLEKSRQHNLSSLTLEVRSSNLPAISLYEKKLFKACGRMKGYYSFPKEDAIIMTYFFREVE